MITNYRQTNNQQPSGAKPSERLASLDIREAKLRTPKTYRTSRQYGAEGYEGALKWALIMPKGFILADSRYNIFQSRIFVSFNPYGKRSAIRSAAHKVFRLPQNINDE